MFKGDLESMKLNQTQPTNSTMFKEDLESMKLNQTQPTNSTMFKEDLESMKLNQMLSILKNVYSVCNIFLKNNL